MAKNIITAVSINCCRLTDLKDRELPLKYAKRKGGTINIPTELKACKNFNEKMVFSFCKSVNEEAPNSSEPDIPMRFAAKKQTKMRRNNRKKCLDKEYD
ncbi:MAG: hypothetical protein P8N00_03190 [Flavobacteriales bacterium]|nr:hypothetical protein [Flavobacteriales bacterium]